MMATSIYDTKIIKTIDGEEIEISPLKIKYLRNFMDAFEKVKEAKNDYEAIGKISECVLTAMKQYSPSIKTVEDVEDNFDLQTMYDIMDVAANIKMGKNANSDQPIIQQEPQNGSDWSSLDLAKLQSEIFLTGIWKNYEELELSISVPELFATLESRRELDYSEKKFLAAMQGIDLDEQTGNGKAQEDPWEAMQARVAAKVSGIGSADPNDITSFQGAKAQQHGFGIGMGLDYDTDL